MADSQQTWLKTLRRFGSRLSLHGGTGARRSSSISGAESDRWLARYDHRRSTASNAAADNEAAYYTTSVELVRLKRDGGPEENASSHADIDVDPTHRRKSNGEGENRLVVATDCNLGISKSRRLFSPIPYPRIIGVPIPGFRDYKIGVCLNSKFSTVKLYK